VPIEAAQLDRLAPFNPLIVRAKGRPIGSINLKESKRRRTQMTRRDASLFERIETAERQEAVGLFEFGLPIPSTVPLLSTAPPATTHIVSSFTYIKRNGNSYKPGTEEPQASTRAMHTTPDDNIEAPDWDRIEGRIEEEEITARDLGPDQ
jgi:hypothetical protein